MTTIVASIIGRFIAALLLKHRLNDTIGGYAIPKCLNIDNDLVTHLQAALIIADPICGSKTTLGKSQRGRNVWLVAKHRPCAAIWRWVTNPAFHPALLFTI